MTSRRRTIPLRRRPDAIDQVTPLQWRRLRDEWREGDPTPEGCEDLEAYFWDVPAQDGSASLTLREAWAVARETVLAEWITARPGTRPSLWWLWDAPPWPPDEIPPRWQGAKFSERLKAPRERLGGIGTPAHECLNYVPTFDYGIPVEWLDQQTVDRYNGRLGEAPSMWTRDWVEGYFPYDALDPDDPPRYESQATYLHRHDCLTPDESRLWAAGKLHTTPEPVTWETDEADEDEKAEPWKA
jgi:hypothetical protein